MIDDNKDFRYTILSIYANFTSHTSLTLFLKSTNFGRKIRFSLKELDMYSSPVVSVETTDIRALPVHTHYTSEQATNNKTKK